MILQNESSPPTRPRRTEQVRSQRYDPTTVYALAEHLRREGVELDRIHGPWRPSRLPLRRPGRNAATEIPIVTDGVAEVAVDTPERATDVSGLLNWCGVNHLEPVPNLRPPNQDQAPV